MRVASADQLSMQSGQCMELPLLLRVAVSGLYESEVSVQRSTARLISGGVSARSIGPNRRTVIVNEAACVPASSR